MHTCTNCRHWQLFRKAGTYPNADFAVDTGECRRYPPALDPIAAFESKTMINDTSLAWANPITTGEHSCGEFKSYTPQPLARLFAWRGT